MRSHRRLSIFLAPAFAAAGVLAQTQATFDAGREAVVGTTLTLPGVTFRDLVLDGIGTQGDFAIDAADADLAGQARFSSPNVLNFGTFLPGPYVYPIPIQSFRIELGQPSSAIRLGLYTHNAPQGNFVDVEFVLAGQRGAVWTLACSGAPGWQDYDIFQCDNPGPYDEIRVRARGSVGGGRVALALDSLTIANAPCGPAPSFCEGRSGGCPCGNTPAAMLHGGCLNSFGGSGLLIASGVASLGADEVLLNASSLPPHTSGILIQAPSTGSAAPFGDGLLCVGPNPTRVLSLLSRQFGEAQYPWPGDLPLSVRCGITSPGQRHLQFVYRNAASFCTPSAFNATNGVSVSWGP